VAEAPADWTGPFALYDGPPSGDKGCPTAFPTHMYGGNGTLTAAPATCTACTCAAPTGQQCNIGSIDVGDSTCSGSGDCTGPQTMPAGWNGACYYNSDGWAGGVATCGTQPAGHSTCDAGTAACNQSIKVDVLTVAGGSCTASTSTPTVAQPSWGTLGEACGGAATVTTGCNAGHACLPKPKDPFVSGLCVQKDGVNACPPVAGSPFTQQHIFYAGVDDTRGCSACACTSPTGGTCSASVTWYPTTNCTGTAVGTANLTTTTPACIALASNPAVGSRKGTFTPPSGSTCTPSGGQPSGTAAPNGATTFCCVP
jgi:hypothetical protein